MIEKPQKTGKEAYHYTRDEEYRTPFGSLPTGQYVTLAIDVHIPCTEVRLCYSYGLYSLYYGEQILSRKEGTEHTFQATIRMPGESCLFFYWFCIKNTDYSLSDQTGHHHKNNTPSDTHINKQLHDLYYVYSREKCNGTGRLSDVPSRVGVQEDRHPAAFQITVFSKEFVTPDWFRGAVMYQIFPDRFHRGSKYISGQMHKARDISERIYHEDWYEDVDILGRPETGYLACDFFGGTLEGIAEKIPYFQDLHIDCIYMNPIFEARSNHRYDTADYMSVDPILGGNASFDIFSAKMKQNNIRFLIDGVFNHTGADSRYFNKFHRFVENGAFQTAMGEGSSKYASWYTFFHDAEGKLKYDAWWGFPDLPNVNENDLSYRNFIFGKNGVLETWLSKGTSGYRLDVSDELPDSFLREIRKVVKEYSGSDAVIMGEVWEDASCKISYGSYRDFLLGNTHDSVMGYTFRDSVIGYLAGTSSAESMHERLETFRENYPSQAFYCIMNLLSSHDVPRALTSIRGEADPGDRASQQTLFLDENRREEGFALMRLAIVLQMCYVGNPCIYYGDEIGMEGYRDPFNRRTYPWDRLSDMQKSQLAFYQKTTALRREYPLLKTGYFRALFAKDDVYVFERFLDITGKDYFGVSCEGCKRIVVALNRSVSTSYEMSLFLEGDEVRVDIHLVLTTGDQAICRAMENEELQIFSGKTELIVAHPLSSYIFIVE